MPRTSVLRSLSLSLGLTFGLGSSVGEAADPGKTYSEIEFLKLVVGKSAEEVRASLGEPKEIVPGKANAEHWYYEGMVQIGKSDRRFARTEVVLSSGRVNHLMNHGSVAGATAQP